jgi:hypothetical protein
MWRTAYLLHLNITWFETNPNQMQSEYSRNTLNQVWIAILINKHRRTVCYIGKIPDWHKNACESTGRWRGKVLGAEQFKNSAFLHFVKWQIISANQTTVSCSVILNNLLSRDWVTIDGAWIGDGIYWTLTLVTTNNYYSLTESHSACI